MERDNINTKELPYSIYILNQKIERIDNLLKDLHELCNAEDFDRETTRAKEEIKYILIKRKESLQAGMAHIHASRQKEETQ